MLTKLRSLPWSLYRCVLRTACFVVRSASSSPTVAPSASTESFLSVYGRSGVGTRIFVAMKLALLECGAVVLQIPHRHVCRGAGRHGHDHVRKCWPRVIQIVLRRPRRMIRMGMIEPQEVSAELAGALFRKPVIRRPHEKSAAGTLFGRVRQRHDRR